MSHQHVSVIREMAQGLKAQSVSEEDVSSVPSTHKGQPQTHGNSDPGESNDVPC